MLFSHSKIIRGPWTKKVGHHDCHDGQGFYPADERTPRRQPMDQVGDEVPIPTATLRTFLQASSDATTMPYGCIQCVQHLTGTQKTTM